MSVTHKTVTELSLELSELIWQCAEYGKSERLRKSKLLFFHYDLEYNIFVSDANPVTDPAGTGVPAGCLTYDYDQLVRVPRIRYEYRKSDGHRALDEASRDVHAAILNSLKRVVECEPETTMEDLESTVKILAERSGLDIEIVPAGETGDGRTTVRVTCDAPGREKSITDFRGTVSEVFDQLHAAWQFLNICKTNESGILEQEVAA